MEIQYFFKEKRYTTKIPVGLENLTLAQTLWLNGTLPPKALCAGLRTCGRCKVRFLSNAPEATQAEKRQFSQEELGQGLRLACRHKACTGMELEVPDYVSSPNTTLPKQKQQVHGGLAIDWGTSTVAWRFCPNDKFAHSWEGQTINPQMPAGSEVMTRLALAAKPDGLNFLRKVSLRFFENLVATLQEKNLCVSEIVLAANPAMACLSVGDKSPLGLSAAPYKLEDEGGAYISTLANLPPVWVAPHLAPFVGGDVSAGLAAVFLDHNVTEPFILADMGTNGEFAFVRQNGHITVTSVPLGPALEGAGLECGGLAGHGSVTCYTLSPSGIQQELFSKKDTHAHSITGAAYLSLLALLKKVGVMDVEGHFMQESTQALARKIIANIDQRQGEAVLFLPDGLYVSAGDVENLLKVKAAFSCALQSLLTLAEQENTPVPKLFLAGALGKHAPLHALETLGFIPSRLIPHTQTIGNSALDGASLLLYKKHRLLLKEKLHHVDTIPLTEMPNFHNIYINSMTF